MSAVDAALSQLLAETVPVGPVRIEIDEGNGDAVLGQVVVNGLKNELWQTCDAGELRQLASDALQAAEWLEAHEVKA